jgi:hypothetical protein
MYKTRHIEQKVRELAKFFKVIIIVGARQVGKSTLLGHLFPELQHITFDPVQDLYDARKSPDLFLANFPAPIILDEIQYAPELLAALKRKVDSSPAMGQYFLTGSQNLAVLKSVAESLAGRAVVLHLSGMTVFEETRALGQDWISAYLREPTTLLLKKIQPVATQKTLFTQLWQGAYPAVEDMPIDVIPNFYASYLQTYIERDVRLLESIRDLHEFSRFLAITAALTAQEINYSQLGREIGLANNTAMRWLDLLTYSYQWVEVWPYFGNTIKRVSKKRKGYIADTGMACYLQRISTPEALAGHPLLGSLFESFCVNMIMATCSGNNISPNFYHWRTNGGAEVDIILELDGCLYPIEIKCKTNVTLQDARGIQAFYATYKEQHKIANGIIIYAGTECYRVAENIVAMPWNGVCTNT